jgi:hypothetical protein
LRSPPPPPAAAAAAASADEAGAAAARAVEVSISCHGLHGILFLDPDCIAELEAQEVVANGFAPTRGASKPQW